MSRQGFVARIALATLLFAVVGVLVYPFVAEKAADQNQGSLWGFWIEQSMEELRPLRPEWRIIKHGFLVSAVGLGIEILILGWRRSSLRRLLRLEDRSTVNDAFYWFIGVFQVAGVIRFVMTLGVASVISFLIKKMSLDLNLVHRIEIPFLRYVAAFLVMDLMGYVQHRLAHSVGWWWELHKVHHSAEKFNMVTFYRTHVLENVPRGIVYGVAISFVGGWHSFIFYAAVLEVISMLVHSEVQYGWGWLERYLLVSPRNHKVHHSIHPDHHDKNFGFTLIIWDRLFGTWHAPKEGEIIEIGLKDNSFNRSNPIADLLRSYKDSVRSLLRI